MWGPIVVRHILLFTYFTLHIVGSLCMDVCWCRDSEDTVLMILKEIYSAMGVTAQKSVTDATDSTLQPPYLPANTVPPSGPFRPPFVRPHFANGSSNSGNVPMFAAPSPQLASSAIGSPPLASAPDTTYLDYSPHPAATSASQSPAVGPPPRSGFVRK